MSGSLWPIMLDALAEAPAPLQALAAEALAGEQPDHLLLVPRDALPAGWWRRRVIPARLIALAPTRLVVVQGGEDAGAPSAWVAPVGRVVTVEWGEVLLYSWLRFSAAADGGAIDAFVEYNSVGWRDIERLMTSLICRLTATTHATEARRSRPAGLELAGPLPLKFKNALRSHLFPGDELLCVVYQPLELETRHHIFRRVRFPATLLAVTGRYLLLLTEEAPVTLRSRPWGTIATYVPLRHIRQMRTETMREAVRLDLTVDQGTVAAQTSLTLAPDRLPDLDAAASAIRQLLSDG